ERRIEIERVAEAPREAVDVPLAAETIAEIEEPASHVARTSVLVPRPDYDPGLHRVLLARVVVVDPGGEQARGAQITAIFVGHDVARIVVARALMREGTERGAGQPVRHAHAQELTAAWQAIDQLVERRLIEGVNSAEVGAVSEAGRKFEQRRSEV